MRRRRRSAQRSCEFFVNHFQTLLAAATSMHGMRLPARRIRAVLFGYIFFLYGRDLQICARARRNRAQELCYQSGETQRCGGGGGAQKPPPSPPPPPSYVYMFCIYFSLYLSFSLPNWLCTQHSPGYPFVCVRLYPSRSRILSRIARARACARAKFAMLMYVRDGT